MADVIAMWEMLIHIIIEVDVNLIVWYRLMLLPLYFIGRCYCQWLVVDVKPLRLMLLPIVYFILLADVIAIHFVADVITT